jgi:hypothetical protein
MPKRKFDSRALRQSAQELVQMIAAEGVIPEGEQDDLVTSLVRQWVTYGGTATLFVEGEQFYLTLAPTALGEPSISPEPALPGWIDRVTRDWKIRPEDLPDAFAQLNRGQSAEVINDDGIPVRFWVNPQERKRGVEPLVKEPLPPGWKRDYRKIAADQVGQHLGAEVEDDDLEVLVCSVAGQWQKYEGHACLFTEEEEFVFTLTELAEGNCQVVAVRRDTDLVSQLCTLGFPPEAIPDVIARINLDQAIEFQDRDGIPSRLWHDPRSQQVRIQALGLVRPAAPGGAPPICCPRCGAVLRLWQAGQQQQRCRHCGLTVAL